MKRRETRHRGTEGLNQYQDSGTHVNGRTAQRGAMTEDELAGMDLAARFEDKPKIVALVAEVRRLRALVKAAYREGVKHGELFGMGIGGGSFDETDARTALDHPTP